MDASDVREFRRNQWMEEGSIRDAREERRLHGRTWRQARDLYYEAAKSAEICGECFQPLGPTDSATMESRQIGGVRQKGTARYVRVPVCLLCTLSNIRMRDALDFFRCRCLGCARPLRLKRPSSRMRWTGDSYVEIHTPPLNEQTCCADCKRLAKNHRNKLRRRVEHEPMICIECGESFVPRRADAVTCSNRCRQAAHRKRRPRDRAESDEAVG
jgi:hypothetical protein